MEYILYNDKLEAVKKRLTLRMNGVVSELMQRNNSQSVNYGLTIPQVKQIALEFDKEEGLALALIRQDVREMKLLSFLLYPPEKLDINKAYGLIEHCSEDLIDPICAFLLYQMDEAEKLAIDLLNNEEEKKLLCAYSLGCHLLKKQKLQRIDLFLQFHTHIISQHLYRNILNFCLFAAKNKIYQANIESELLQLDEQHILHQQFKQEVGELLLFID